MAIEINGESPYRYGRTGLETIAGRRATVRMLDGSEVTGTLTGGWPTGFELDLGAPTGNRYLYFKDVASIRPA